MEERIARQLHTALSESPLFNMSLAKMTGGVSTTTRNLTTIRRLLAKYPAPE